MILQVAEEAWGCECAETLRFDRVLPWRRFYDFAVRDDVMGMDGCPGLVRPGQCEGDRQNVRAAVTEEGCTLS